MKSEKKPNLLENREQIEKAKEAVGKYRAKVKDLAQNHDRYLTEDLNK